MSEIQRVDHTSEAVRNKVRALRAMTAARGCTEAEALTAARKAAEIMGQHGLSEELIELPPFARARIALPSARTRKPWSFVWSAIAQGCCCQIWRSNGSITYFGFEPDVIVAEYLHQVMAGAAERARRDFIKTSPEYRRRRARKTKALEVNSFLDGFMRILSGRIVEALRADRPDRVRREELVEEEVARLGMEFATARQQRGPKVANGWSRNAGARAAHAVGIHQGVKAGARPGAVGRTLMIGGREDG